MPDKDKKENSELLKSIREDYTYGLNYWRENREASAEDMRFVAADFWSNTERQNREGRPCLSPDEISQYIKQADNNRRQNKVGIQVTPSGEGANDEVAQLREAAIRAIEYRSKAQSVYTSAFEPCVSMGFGAFRINLEYVTSSGFVTEPRIRSILNPFTVIPDPDAKEPDRSDMERCFVLDLIAKRDFERRYPNAEQKSWTQDDINMAPDWFRGESIVVAEAWRVEKKKRNKLLARGKGSKAAPFSIYDDEKDFDKQRESLEILNDRTVYERQVIQYITNGLEILEKNEWIGSRIPIICVFGEQIYVNDGGGSKLMVMSLIRRARTAQKMLAFIASNEAELFGMAPRVPLQGYKGQFNTNREVYSKLNEAPVAFVETDIPDDWNPAWGPPPLPGRLNYAPDIAAYEGAYERWRRGLQAAVGVTPLPTAAQRQNEKSGVALEKIQTQEAIGSFHFQDNMNLALQNAGWQLNELLTKTTTEPRMVSVRKADETHATIYLTTKEHGKANLPADFSGDVLVADEGEFDVTVSTGPSFQSQREAANSFVDLLVQYLGKLPVPPPVATQLLALGIKLKNLGPIGDQIAKLLTPQNDDVPPQAQAAIAQAQGMVQQLQGELSKLMQEKQGKVVENEYRLKLEAMKAAADITLEQMKIEAQVTAAEITTKAQSVEERIAFVEDMMKQLHGQAHDLALQKDQQTHEQGMADQQAQIASAQSAQDAAQNQVSAGPANGQNEEQ